MNLSRTAEKAINAYGGMDLWQNHTFIEAEVSVKGLAFTLKRRPFFDHAKILMEIRKPYCKITPIGKDHSISGIIDHDNVRLENSSGEIVAERINARASFPYGRRLFWWDDLDMAYFSNYAFWNYFTLPSLLMNPAIDWKEKEDGLLEATFPNDIPTHCPVQEFRFDKETGLLLQHNYTAEIISKLATAANVVKEHRMTENYPYPSRRIVTPQGGNGKVLGFPVLIDITVHHFRLTNH